MKLQICLILAILLEFSCQNQDYFLGETHEYGFIPISKSEPEYKLFYWLFKNRKNVTNPPLIIWIEGGPGCSSEQAIFMEFGPYRILHGQNNFTLNAFSWNNEADILFFDQPLGTGLSNCSNISRIPKNTEQTVQDFYGFFTNFLELHPEYSPKFTKLIFGGHSYAGHFLPATVLFLLENKFPYKIIGCIMGNAYINPEAVLWSYPKFAFHKNLIPEYVYLIGNFLEKIYQIILNFGWENLAFELFNYIQDFIIGIKKPRFLPYDIRGKEIPFNDFDKLMKESIINEIGMQEYKWESCNWEISSKIMTIDQIHDFSYHVSQILKHNEIYSIFYYGTYDFVCNTESFEKTLVGLEWEGKSEFEKSEWRDYWVNGKIKGKIKGNENVWLIHAYNSGHIVVYNEPEFTYDLITKIINLNKD